jgi:ABC-2 type transport system permease protein
MPAPLYKLLAFTLRGFRLASSYRLNFLGTYLGGVLLIVFFAVLQQLFGAHPPAIARYGDYFTFLLIGGIFGRFLSFGMRHFGRELEQEMATGTLEPMLATATSPVLVLLGPSLWVAVEGVLLMLIQFLAGVLFFDADLSRANWTAALALGAISLLALSSWGVLSAAFMLLFKRADPLSWLVDVTIFLLAGVYFPVSLLPVWLKVPAYLLPLSYALEAMRLALMRGQSLSQLAGYAGILLLFNVLLIPAGLLAFRRALTLAKRSGSLGHY